MKQKWQHACHGPTLKTRLSHLLFVERIFQAKIRPFACFGPEILTPRPQVTRFASAASREVGGICLEVCAACRRDPSHLCKLSWHRFCLCMPQDTTGWYAEAQRPAMRQTWMRPLPMVLASVRPAGPTQMSVHRCLSQRCGVRKNLGMPGLQGVYASHHSIRRR